MRIDAHQHFWNYNDKEYGWISDEMSNLRQSFSPEDLTPLLTSIDFDGTIAVQARQNLEETEFLLKLASDNDIIKGVVGWVDLCSESVDKQLERYTKNPYLKGIRHIIHDEPDDQFMLREDFQKGLKTLGDFGLTYDLLLFPKHLPYAVELVKNFPEQAFVLDHIGKPDIKNSTLSPWKEDIQQLASYKNVYCKVSGMVTEADWSMWKECDFTEYLDIVFKAFGSERVMIGSDWPVCTVSHNYQAVMEIVLHYLENHRPEDKANVLGETCRRFYRL